MPLTGTFERSLDEKQRVALPKPLRDQLCSEQSNTFFVAPGNDKCLALYSCTAFQELADRLTKLSSGQSDVRNFLRIFYSQAESLEADKQGRIRLPARLVTFAGLESQVVVVGVRDHAEIWQAERWQQIVAANAEDFDALTTKAMELLNQ